MKGAVSLCSLYVIIPIHPRFDTLATSNSPICARLNIYTRTPQLSISYRDADIGNMNEYYSRHSLDLRTQQITRNQFLLALGFFVLFYLFLSYYRLLAIYPPAQNLDGGVYVQVRQEAPDSSKTGRTAPTPYLTLSGFQTPDHKTTQASKKSASPLPPHFFRIYKAGFLFLLVENPIIYWSPEYV